MAKSSVPGPVRRPSSLRPCRARRQAPGLSLVELLVGVVISIVVLGGAVRLLVSLIRSDGASQMELNRKDAVGRVLGLMQDEIRNAQRVESIGTLMALSGCTTTPQLILRGATAGEDISYGLLPQAADATWRGPNVLVRCGLPYVVDPGNPNGYILDPGANRSEQVILDGLAPGGFTAGTLGGTGTISRNVALTLISSPAAGSITSSVQVPISINQIYGLASSGATGTCPGGTGSFATGCPDPNGSIHYRPTLGGANIAGSSSLEDIFYFDGGRADYTLSRTPGTGLCTNDQCTVRLGAGGNSITFTNGDVIVFRDRQIRL